MAGLAFSDPLERLARRKHHQRVLLFKERAKNINQLASVQREDILTDQTMTEAEKVSACKEVDEDVRRAVLRAKRECGFDVSLPLRFPASTCRSLSFACFWCLIGRWKFRGGFTDGHSISTTRQPCK